MIDNGNTLPTPPLANRAVQGILMPELHDLANLALSNSSVISAESQQYREEVGSIIKASNGFTSHPTYKSDIDLIISDLDNTLTDSFTEASYLFKDLELYISSMTGLTKAKVHNIIRSEVNKFEIGKGKFCSSDFFSYDGYKKILESDIWRGVGVNDYVLVNIKERFRRSYTSIYPDTLDAFKALKGHTPIVIHTDAPIEQAMGKLVKGGLITLSKDENGKVHATSLISGISASSRPSSKNAEAQELANRKMAEVKEALAEIGVFVTTFPHKDEKPSPVPIQGILSELKRTTGKTFDLKKTLMIGDSLAKDIVFASRTGIGHAAWMIRKSPNIDNLRHLEDATITTRNPMTWQSQIDIFYKNMKKTGEDPKELLSHTKIAICSCFPDVFNKYDFAHGKDTIDNQKFFRELTENSRKL